MTRQRRLPSPVISIGGLAMGGSGKTPLVRMLARSFNDSAVLIRGYRRVSSHRVTILPTGASAPVALTGDEAQMILRDGYAQLGIGADRYAVGIQMKAGVFLLDDGFQHARLHRNLDIVVLDGLDPLAGGYVFPAGRLREPTSALRRADAIVIARSDGRRFDGLLRVLPSGVPVFYGSTRIAAWQNNTTGERSSCGAMNGKTVFAFCGLGNPESFRRTLERAGCNVAGFRVFADHHPYTEADLTDIEKSSGSHPIVTTEKDAVRLPRPVGYSLLIEAEVPALMAFVKSRIFPHGQ